ncbi:TraB/GumN family protein [Rhizobium sp. CSW-27]|uniref:TraB/GumN family protein n=1 Tax=Rhizobium sp. CSW-27 TaxID=2839985 RepID=UPI002078BDBC|nr:TraB/GumN family protein [Rhizobium sp. CSW-27]
MTRFAFRSFPMSCRPGDLLLRMLATLHVLALLSFLLVLGWLQPVAAAEDSCGGTNLAAQMQATDPAAYARIRGEADRVANGRSIFWKIEKPGLAPSFLLGTMHLTDPRVLAMPQAAMQAKAAAKVIVVESDEILDPQKAMSKLMTKPQLTMMTDGRTLQSYLTADETRLLEASLKKRGIPLAAVSRMQPWMLYSFFALSTCEMTRKARGEAFLDQKIAEDAVRAGKPVKGLETLEEQLESMAAVPTQLHMKSLMEGLDRDDQMGDITATTIDLYLAGDIGMIMPLLKSVSPDGADGEGYAAFEQRIVTERNHRMAERALPILKDGGAFIAVGAMHLVGDEGLVSLLRKAGYTLTPAS